MKIFSDERLINLGIISGTVSRATGTGRDIENVKKFFDMLDIDHTKILGLKQAHGTNIIPLIADEDLKNYRAQTAHEADAWLLGKPGYGCLILTADCAPLYVWDDKGKFAALAHCGWRGIVEGLPAKIAAAVKEKAGNGAKLCAYIGPHIRSCCFEIKEDVAAKLNPKSVIKKEGKIYGDLSAEIILQLSAAGISAADIKQECKCTCTMCNKEDFFSYRRDKTRDVMMSFIYKPV